MKVFLLLFLILFSAGLLAETKVAVVKLIRGEADILTLGKTTKLKVDDWVENGAVVKTAERSFVKLVFIDKSQMNVGPNSEMKIESFSGKDSGVIDLVKGKIRSQVTKDYLQIKDKDKSKLFIKTQNAVMGVRGTDFMISTNGTNTSTILFEGEIVFNKLDHRGSLSSEKLEEIVDKGVRVFPGEFSVMEGNRPIPTVPSLLNIQQKEHLEKNKEFNTDRAPGSAQGTSETAKSIVPEGLNGQIVGNHSDTLKTEVASLNKPESQTSSDPNGFVKGDQVKPANGSFVHVDSGIIIPPGANAVLDKNTNTYIPGQDTGKVAADGSYIPPKNIEITNDGKIIVTMPDHTGETVRKEVPPPVPVVAAGEHPFKDAQRIPGSVDMPQVGVKPPRDVLLPQPGMDNRFMPSGGFIGPNDPSRVLSNGTGTVDTTIRVKPE